MCECCDDVVKRLVKRSAEQPSIRGEPLGIRIIVLPLEPKAPDRNIAAVDEKARPTVEEAAAG